MRWTMNVRLTCCIFLIIGLLAGGFIGFILVSKDIKPCNDVTYKMEDSMGADWSYIDGIPKIVDAIPDADAASRMANVVLSKIYGQDTIRKEMPFQVSFDKEYEAWIIEGTLPKGSVGGVATIVMQKKDAKILVIHHSK